MTNPHLHSKQNLFHATVIALSLLGLCATSHAVAGTSTAETLGSEHQLICIEVGLTPEAMAAMGVQGYQVGGIFEEIDDQSTAIASLHSLQSQHQNAMASLKTAYAAIRHAEDQAEEAQMQGQIDQLVAEIGSLSQSIAQTKAQIRDSILPNNINSQTIDRVCRPEGLAAHVPVEFRFTTLQQSDYADLIPALNAERRAQNDGEMPDTDVQLLLSGYRNLPAILQARSNLLYNLDAVRSAFNN